MAKKKTDFESQLKRLQEIVRLLEQGDLPLEQGVSLFKEGTELASSCRKRLEEARHQVSVLSQGVLKDFEPGGQGESGDDR